MDTREMEVKNLGQDKILEATNKTVKIAPL